MMTTLPPALNITDDTTQAAAGEKVAIEALEVQMRALNQRTNPRTGHAAGALTQLLEAKQTILTHVPHEPRELRHKAAELRTATEFLYHYVHSTSATDIDFPTRMMRVVAAGEVLKRSKPVIDQLQDAARKSMVDVQVERPRLDVERQVLEIQKKPLDSVEAKQAANNAALPPIQTKLDAIAQYNAALPEVLEFVAQAEQYLTTYEPQKLAEAQHAASRGRQGVGR